MSVQPNHSGLTDSEVAARIKRGESNNYKVRVDRTYWQIIRDNILNIFNFVLFSLVIILISFRQYNEIVFASFAVIMNSLIGMIQEIRAKRSLDRLAALGAHDVRVRRNGQDVLIPISNVVKDDILPLTPGDRLVVDGRLLETDSLEVDESLLTGESDAIMKEPGQDGYSGSFVITGTGLMIATQVGANSTVNKLSRTAKAYKNVRTPTQIKVEVYVELVLAGMCVFCPMLIIAGLVQHLPTQEIVKNTLVLVTSFVPQGLVLATTLSLTLGAVSISRHKTLVQRVNAVESLANANILCFDKTGTLTCNELAVTETIPLNGEAVDAIFDQLYHYVSNLAHQNKTAAAITRSLGKRSIVPEKKLQEIPFTSGRKWGAIVLPDQTLILGAPERVLPENNQALTNAKTLSEQGQRVLALASSSQTPQGNTLSSERKPIALIVMSDQIRPDIHETLDAFYAQNIELKVISGDNAETVSAIARQAGIRVRDAYTGQQLEAMSDEAFNRAVKHGNVFARIEPDTKRKIVAALRKQRGYVAMVGDGVNDVPALKEAELAIVMNDGTQISKDVADIVLLNNAMSTLPRAFAEGKLITQKIYGTAKIFLTKNIFHILLFIMVSFMALPFPITPIQISWIVFGTVNLPALFLAFGLMRPAPMSHFGKHVMRYVVTAGVVGALSMTIVFAIVYLGFGEDLKLSRTALSIFMGLYGIIVYLNTFGVDVFEPMSLLNRAHVVIVGLVLTVITIGVPFLLPHIFSFVPITAPIVGIMVAMLILAAVALHFGLRQERIIRNLEELGKA